MQLSEYLVTAYRRDREYIDGELLERNLGEVDHSRLQMLVARYLSNREKEWGVVILPEQRVQVTAIRYRVPDISVVLGPLPATPILREPTFLCSEILSRDDSMYDVQDRIDLPRLWRSSRLGRGSEKITGVSLHLRCHPRGAGRDPAHRKSSIAVPFTDLENAI